jgi:hypothetical protein
VDPVKTLALLLLAALAGACAAHNSHRVPIDLNAELAPLIDEAWASMEAAWRAPVPVGGVPVDVQVEPVVVQWLPFSPDVPPGGSTLSQDELRTYIVEALRVQHAGTVEPARAVKLQLLTDLHDPGSIGLVVHCALVDALAPGTVLAGGASSVLRFERLYCHGCRERWGGDGTRLPDPPIPSDGVVHGGAGWVLFPAWIPDSSPGYIKR